MSLDGWNDAKFDPQYVSKKKVILKCTRQKVDLQKEEESEQVDVFNDIDIEDALTADDEVKR